MNAYAQDTATDTWPLAVCLSDLESRIDDGSEQELWRQWSNFTCGKCEQEVFIPQRPRKIPPRCDWPQAPTNMALDDFDAMALQQMWICSQELSNGSGKIMNVRSNYGTPIMPMLFGVELFRMPDSTDTLPSSRPLPGGADGLRRMLDEGEPSLDQPYMNKVWEMGWRFKKIQSRYPNIGRHVHLYHPDFQGPMDILEMIIGSSLFVLLVDEPELVHQALDLVTRTYIRAMDRWLTIEPLREDGLSTHWGLVHPGAIMLRDDSAMNLSPDMFMEYVRPYDQLLLEKYGGGAIHACGRVDHFAPFLPDMPGLRAFNMSQPHLNNMEIVWQNTVDRSLLVIDADGHAVQDAVASGRRLHGRVHVGYPTALLLERMALVK